jgi:hypothetical protein
MSYVKVFEYCHAKFKETQLFSAWISMTLSIRFSLNTPLIGFCLEWTVYCFHPYSSRCQTKGSHWTVSCPISEKKFTPDIPDEDLVESFICEGTEPEEQITLRRVILEGWDLTV